jgi:phospholipase/carboxylesterase
MQVINIAPTTGTKPAGLVVVLHGWGANAQDLATVVPFLNLPDYQFVLPDAPFNHPHVAGGKAWYDFQQNNQGYAESKQLLTDWLKSLEKETGVPLSQTILSGFSQGAAMTLDVGLHLPLAGLVALSGYLHPITESPSSAIAPILLVHGRQDSVVPLIAAQKARDSLLAMGAKVQYQEFDMGHEIRPEVIALIRNFVMAQQKVS